jgi:hypothetical protein
MDISSLCRDEGIRNYFKKLHRNYLHCGGITLAQRAEEEEEAKRGGKMVYPVDHEEEHMDSDNSD